MAFESGSVGFRAFYLGRRLPDDYIARFAAQAAPPLNALGREPVHGWVTGRHLLDRHITEETAHLGGYLRLCLMRAERRIPAPLLRAECMMEELAELQARGVDRLNRADRSRIRKQVVERLLPKMPPQLQGIAVVCAPDDDLVLATALSDKQVESFALSFRAATGLDPVPVSPLTASLKRRRTSVRDLPPASFSPECADEEVLNSPGADFLTWLWFFSERRGGLLATAHGEFAVMLQGPLLFVMEGGGAHEARLRRGEPLVSAEAKTALLSGKKLRAATIVLARGGEQWTAALDGEQFAFRGLKMPEVEDVDAAGRFQARILSMRVFLEALLNFYDQFVDERLDGKRWRKTRAEIHEWVSARGAKR